METQRSKEGYARFDAMASKTFGRILRMLSLDKKKTLDIGCGFGEHLIHFGPGSIGLTASDREVDYGQKQGISIKRGNAELIDETPVASESFQAIWANNIFEHLLSPHSFLIRLREVSDPDTVLILGVPVIPRIASLLKIRKFCGALQSAHVDFFTRESLKLTVERGGWTIRWARPFLIGNRFIDEYLLGPFMPHLYVVATKNVHFKYSEKKINEWKYDSHYDKLIKIVMDQP